MDPEKTTEEHLRGLHQALKDQFLYVEAGYEAHTRTFEVKIGEDGEEANGALVCVAMVEFEDG